MVIRKLVIAFSCVAFLTAATESKALPADPVVVATTGSAFTGGAWIAAGVIGVAATLCAYDLVLKIQGVKNWDGSAKVLKKSRR